MALTGDTRKLPTFTPGRGEIPPYLAGREQEQERLNLQHDILASGGRVPRDIVLLGPRGNGKTALLRWFENEARRRGEIDAVWVTPTEIATAEDMAMALAPGAGSVETSVRANVGLLSGEWTFGGERHRSLKSLLLARCRRKPLVVLLDEAHRLDLAMGEALLNLSQAVGNRAPFLLCLAGTPGLEDRLNRMGATFESRAEELRIRLLDRDAAEAALVEPLSGNGVSIDPDVLKAVIDASQRYPYFIQEWGDALLNAAGGTTITQKTLKSANSAFRGMRERFYMGRYRELEDAGLLAAAEAVAQTFADSGAPVLNGAVMDRTLQRVGAGLTERRALNARGYIWVPLHPDYLELYGEADVWEPGIPSLMDHVLKKAAARDAV